MDPVKAADTLKAAADDLLTRTGILGTLAEYGQLRLTGSYAYDLMTWRDIDMCVAVAAPTPDLMFQIGAKLATIPRIATMYFRNEYVLQTPGNPVGMFWCIEIREDDAAMWKIDILVATPDETERIVASGKRRIAGMTIDQRRAILRIKGELTGDPEYRRAVRSTDIYEAVMQGNVRTLDEWRSWRSVGRNP